MILYSVGSKLIICHVECGYIKTEVRHALWLKKSYAINNKKTNCAVYSDPIHSIS